MNEPSQLQLVKEIGAVLRDKYEEFLKVDDLFLGSSPACLKLQGTCKERIWPVIQWFAKAYSDKSQENSVLKIKNESLEKESAVEKLAITEMDAAFKELCSNTTMLWNFTAIFAHLCVTGDKAHSETEDCRKQAEIRARNISIELQKTRNQLCGANQLIRSLMNDLKDLKSRQVPIDEIRNGVKLINMQLDINNNEQYVASINEIEKLKRDMMELQRQSESQHEEDTEIIKRLREELASVKEEAENERQKLIDHISTQDEELNKLRLSAKREKVLENAIKNHCRVNRFLVFDETEITYKTGMFSQPISLEMELEEVRRERKSLEEENKSLLAGIEKVKQKYTKRANDMCAVSAAKLQQVENLLAEARRDRDTAVSSKFIDGSKIKSLEGEKARLEKENANLQKLLENRDKTLKESREREVRASRRYEESLSAFTGVSSNVSFFTSAPLTLQAVKPSDSVYEESNKILRDENNSLQKKNCELEQSLTEYRHEIESLRKQKQRLDQKVKTDEELLKRVKQLEAQILELSGYNVYEDHDAPETDTHVHEARVIESDDETKE